METCPVWLAHSQIAKVRKVLVVVANAQTYKSYDWSNQGKEPGMIEASMASFDAALGILNRETASLAKQGFQMWAQRITASRAADTPSVKVYFSVLTFNSITDAAQRTYFESLPTSFHLEPQAVDALSGLAGQLLDASPEYIEFVRSFQ